MRRGCWAEAQRGWLGLARRLRFEAINDFDPPIAFLVAQRVKSFKGFTFGYSLPMRDPRNLDLCERLSQQVLFAYTKSSCSLTPVSVSHFDEQPAPKSETQRHRVFRNELCCVTGHGLTVRKCFPNPIQSVDYMDDWRTKAGSSREGLAAAQCFSRSQRKTSDPDDAALIREATADGKGQGVVGWFWKPIVDDDR